MGRSVDFIFVTGAIEPIRLVIERDLFGLQIWYVFSLCDEGFFIELLDMELFRTKIL